MNATVKNVYSVSIDETDRPALCVVAVAHKRFDPRVMFEHKRKETTKGLCRPILQKHPSQNVDTARVASTKHGDYGERKDVCTCGVVNIHKFDIYAF